MVIGPGGNAVYALLEGEPLDRPLEQVLPGDIQALIDHARKASPETAGATLGITSLSGHPNSVAFVSAEALTPGDDQTVAVTDGPPSILLLARRITSPWLDEIGQQSFVRGLSVMRAGTTDSSLPAITLTGTLGASAYALQWDPADPGQGMLDTILPWLLLGGLSLIGLTVLLVDNAIKSAATADAGARRLGQALSEAKHIALHDFVTGLPNRRGLMDQVERLLMTRGEAPIALAFIDIDRFKVINDALGHAVGDQVLSVIAHRLRRAVPEGDLVARTGGDEFVVVTTVSSDDADLAALCGKITAITSQPVTLDSGIIHLTLSIGVAHISTEVASAEELMRRADIAMYQAKSSGRGRYRLFDGQMNDQAVSRRVLESELRDALQRDELVLHFQPRFCASTLRVLQVETLLRWQHPRRGLIGPDNFISIAEDLGLISDIGAWVLRQACLAIARWPGISISVNVSAVQLLRGDLPDIVRGALADAGIAPQRLELELTESIMFEDQVRTQEILAELKAIGVRLALDDFGTGFSSLGYLIHYPFDCLKIDRSFIEGLKPSGSERAIVQAMIALGRALKLQLVAEGVETEEQLRLLRADNCDEVQGFHLARPMPQDALTTYLGSPSLRSQRA